MSSDNGIVLNLSELEVYEYMGDRSGINPKKFKTLEKAVLYAQSIDDTEYGITFIGELKKNGKIKSK